MDNKNPFTKMLFFMAVCGLLFCSCNHENSSTEKEEYEIYSGRKWDIVKVNDSIFICVPGLNADAECVPKVINTKTYR